MTQFDKTLQFLYDLQLFGIKVGLHNIRTLLRYLGHPERQFPSIHIAGTNGKGSTAAMLAAILCASGYKTGLYTSPNLVHFSERIRINGKKISEEEIVRYTRYLQPAIRKTKATFFEATTAIAFQYFADQRVDVAVIETGLGGRLDATNVLTPILSIITNVGLDHMEYLGSTYSSVAFEKGGIIKPSIPCLVGDMNTDALTLLQRIARKMNASLFRCNKLSTVRINDNTLAGLRVALETDRDHYNDVFLPLAGEHQSKNLQLAVLAVERVRESLGFYRITKETITAGLCSLQRYSGLRGRIDVLSTKPLVVADVAHNPAAIKTLLRSLKDLLVGRVVIVFGVMKDKSYGEMIDLLAPMTRLAITVEPHTDRALGSDAIMTEFHHRSTRAIDGGDVNQGFARALDEQRNLETVLVTGSHYVVGEVLNFLNMIA
ncbi:MAG: bifunctional folylpolyglutamate synthase/dihydrofolate synthase [Ignavibacteriales bacterium]|nr:bifunctional folylpolyglutamate synthase/dihydrofolate synthase [Ignavibacteriales bacterium]